MYEKVDSIREALIKSARMDCEEIFRKKEARFHRNTECISRKCNKFMA